MTRVATRVWIVPMFILFFLASYGLNLLVKRNFNKKVVFSLLFLILIESIFLSLARLSKPVETQKPLSPQIIQAIKSDSDLFRVFCLTRCIPPKVAAYNNFELIEGYNTLIQKNYYQEAWQLTGKYWNYYSLSIPPIGTHTFEKLNPDAKALGEYNTKYIISPYNLSTDFELINSHEGFYLYKNRRYLPRAYFQNSQQKALGEARILIYRPNLIRIDTSGAIHSQLVLSNVYNSGWQAYQNGIQKTPVQEKSNGLILVDIDKNASYIDFKYLPESFLLGRIISLCTLLLLIFLKPISQLHNFLKLKHLNRFS